MESDAELIRRSSAGDPSSFVELVRRHERAIYKYLARRVGQTPAEDLLSDIWLAAFGDRAHFNTAWESARPWLFGIARNRVRSHWRRHPAALEAEPSSDPWPDVDARLVSSANMPSVVAALKVLPADDREVLLLVAWEELTPTEAALVLGIPAGTARSRLHRARTALRNQLEGLTDGPTVIETCLGGKR
jgi:RNA polymerase sigma-70 factor (ECF subfamily)